MRTLKRLTKQLFIGLGILAVVFCSLAILPAYQTFSGMTFSGTTLGAQGGSGDVNSNVSSNTNGQVAVFGTQTDGKHITTSSVTGFLKATAGVLSATAFGSHSDCMRGDGVIDSCTVGSGSGHTPGVGLRENPGDSTIMEIDPAAVATTIFGTQSIDFGSMATKTCSTQQTFSFTGAAVGNRVEVGYPAGFEDAVIVRAIVTAADTIKYQACNFQTITADPINQTFTVTVTRSF